MRLKLFIYFKKFLRRRALKKNAYFFGKMEKEIRIIKVQLEEMRAYLPLLDQKKLSVSSVNVGWHISHSLKVLNNVIQALQHSDPAKFEKKFSFLRLYIFLFRRIPRGKAKAPAAVLPDKDLKASALDEEIEEVITLLSRLNDLPKKAFFKHPFFGKINRDQTVKFLGIHTGHHLKIIKDILK